MALLKKREAMIKKYFILTILLGPLLYSSELDGKKVFETYCWGCHHQTAEAFGPSFAEIASKRTNEEIQAYIIDPESMYKAFGYKRTVMTKLKLNDKEREAVANYVLSYKGK
jgi:mono/diheme cytochrome c family protein